MNAILNRRSIRKFKNMQVEAEKIDLLLRAAMQAPSAGNQQPWEFLVVQDKESLQKLSLMSPYSKLIADSPLAIILLGNEEKMKFAECWEQDMSAATQNILLQATEMGLGSVWLGVSPLADRIGFIKDMFDLPETIIPFSVVAIGYPWDEQGNIFVDRYDETRVHYEKY